MKQKPVRKVIDPPAFEKIDTRLSRTDAENRMGVRISFDRAYASCANSCSVSGRPYRYPNAISPFWTILTDL